MIFKRSTKHYLCLTPTEATLAIRALRHFTKKPSYTSLIRWMRMD